MRIGYFSADFHIHATMFLIGGLFEAHDRSRFEIHAFSYGPDYVDSMRRRARDGVDAFHDVRGMSDAAVAQLARETGIDIAIDLKGYTKFGRAGIFAHRAAPVQISWLGYPGTTGAPFIDYMIADDVVVPDGDDAGFSEKVIRLPGSYQINDNRRSISDKAMSRAEFGLPEEAFVFCCLNASYKISAVDFDLWMRLLQKTKGSVLWLMKSNKGAEERLRAEVRARGIDDAVWFSLHACRRRSTLRATDWRTCFLIHMYATHIRRRVMRSGPACLLSPDRAGVSPPGSRRACSTPWICRTSSPRPKRPSRRWHSSLLTIPGNVRR